MTDEELAREYYGLRDTDPPDCELAKSVRELKALLARVRLDEAGFFYGALKEDGTLLSFYLAEIFSKRIATLEQIVREKGEKQ